MDYRVFPIFFFTIIAVGNLTGVIEMGEVDTLRPPPLLEVHEAHILGRCSSEIKNSIPFFVGQLNSFPKEIVGRAIALEGFVGGREFYGHPVLEGQ